MLIAAPLSRLMIPTLRSAALAWTSAEHRIADAPRTCQHWGPDRPHHQPKEIIMNSIRHIRRLASVLAGLAGIALASAAAVPTAFAATNPIPYPAGYVGDPYIGTSPVAPVPATTVRVINTGGMAGWQIALIAIGAALLAATATVAVLLDRARATRRNAVTAAT
jgi:hypothetical protein